MEKSSPNNPEPENLEPVEIAEIAYSCINTDAIYYERGRAYKLNIDIFQIIQLYKKYYETHHKKDNKDSDDTYNQGGKPPYNFSDM